MPVHGCLQELETALEELEEEMRKEGSTAQMRIGEAHADRDAAKRDLEREKSDRIAERLEKSAALAAALVFSKEESER